MYEFNSVGTANFAGHVINPDRCRRTSSGLHPPHPSFGGSNVTGNGRLNKYVIT
jgi:hypothetical protein